MFGHPMRNQWSLDPAVTYLNHGTVGAPPRRALEAQQRLREEIELQPSRFLLRELSSVRVGTPHAGKPRLRVAAAEVAEFVGASGDDLVFVDNATSGINAVLRSFDFHEGDELLIFDGAYGAVRNAAEYAMRTCRGKVCELALPETTSGPEAIVTAIESAIGPRTRLAVIDHISSGSALILPVADLATVCRRHSVAVLVDGAHGPGAIPLCISDLGVDWYSGNLHKWAWAPRSSGILWSHPSRQRDLHPAVISWGLEQGYLAEFDWPGTRDPTPHLAAPAALAYMRELGVEAVQRYNHELAWKAGCTMASHWATTLLGTESMIGSMVTVPMPERLGSTIEDADALRDGLLFDDRIEVQVHARQGRLMLRVSAQIYNQWSDIEKLVDAIDRRLRD
jgi:isopenicillin-N epimerase